MERTSQVASDINTDDMDSEGLQLLRSINDKLDTMTELMRQMILISTDRRNIVINRSFIEDLPPSVHIDSASEARIISKGKTYSTNLESLDFITEQESDSNMAQDNDVVMEDESVSKDVTSRMADFRISNRDSRKAISPEDLVLPQMHAISQLSKRSITYANRHTLFAVVIMSLITSALRCRVDQLRKMMPDMDSYIISEPTEVGRVSEIIRSIINLSKEEVQVPEFNDPSVKVMKNTFIRSTNKSLVNVGPQYFGTMKEQPGSVNLFKAIVHIVNSLRFVTELLEDTIFIGLNCLSSDLITLKDGNWIFDFNQDYDPKTHMTTDLISNSTSSNVKRKQVNTSMVKHRSVLNYLKLRFTGNDIDKSVQLLEHEEGNPNSSYVRSVSLRSDKSSVSPQKSLAPVIVETKRILNKPKDDSSITSLASSESKKSTKQSKRKTRSRHNVIIDGRANFPVADPIVE